MEMSIRNWKGILKTAMSQLSLYSSALMQSGMKLCPVLTFGKLNCPCLAPKIQAVIRIGVPMFMHTALHFEGEGKLSRSDDVSQEPNGENL